MKEVKFQADGEQLSVRIEFGYAHIASYRLRLWESKNSVVVIDKSGDNKNPNDNSYNLPLPTKNNDRRLLQLEVSLLSPTSAQGEQYSATLIFKQGNKEIDRMTEQGTMNSSPTSLELLATFLAE